MLRGVNVSKVITWGLGFGFWIQGFQSVKVKDLILGVWGSCEGCGVQGVRGIKFCDLVLTFEF